MIHRKAVDQSDYIAGILNYLDSMPIFLRLTGLPSPPQQR